MGKCLNCGSTTVFDIPSQGLKCISCGSTFPVPQDNIPQNGTYTINTFSCPQCGAELNTTDTSMAEFCSYCGTPVVLEGRVSQQQRPKMIAPFRVGKEQIRENFIRKVSQVRFLAKEFKDHQYIESMRGIYIPYWSYRADMDGAVQAFWHKDYTSGSYDVHEEYSDSINVQATYDGILHDASASFFDDVGQEIQPFRMQDTVEFQTGYLSGFYADIPDVPYQRYMHDATSDAVEFVGLDVENKLSRSYDRINAAPQITAASCVMLPTWFLTYRKGDRVAYMVANGQSGKIVSDYPVDYKSAFRAVGIVSLIVYLIMLFMPALSAKFLLVVAPLVAQLIAGGYVSQRKAILKRNNGGKKVKGHFILSSLVSTLCGFNMIFVHNSRNISGRDVSSIALVGFLSLIALLINILVLTKRRESFKSIRFVLLDMLIPVISIVMAFINPVSDVPYYIVAFLSCMIIITMLCGLLLGYQELATRAMPHFNKSGGDNRAY